MAYSSPYVIAPMQITVNTVADLADLAKIDACEVTVLDASADVDVTSGKALYRYSKAEGKWVRIWKEEIDTFKKHAEVLVIADGKVTTAYPIIDNIPTVLKVVRTSNTKFVIANPVIEEISIANKVIDLGTTEFDGESIYVVYDYSSVSPQMETAFQDFKNTAIAIGEL
jgi:uncharacterized protein YbaR (Trm112 family)